MDRINLNGPTYGAWEFQVIEDYKKKYPDEYKRIKKHSPHLLEYIRTGSLIKILLKPFVTYCKEGILFYITSAKKYKEFGAVTYEYKKENGWTEDGVETFDIKKKYDYVIYGYDDGGEFNKDCKLYKHIIEFVKASIKLKRLKDGRNVSREHKKCL